MLVLKIISSPTPTIVTTKVAYLIIPKGINNKNNL